MLVATHDSYKYGGGSAHVSLRGFGMLASTALISRDPNPVAVLLCFGRCIGSVIPAAGAGGVSEIGADILESTPVLLVT